MAAWSHHLRLVAPAESESTTVMLVNVLDDDRARSKEFDEALEPTPPDGAWAYWPMVNPPVP